MSIRTLAALVLLMLSSLPARAQTPPAAEDSDEGCPEQRIHEYIERHGDFGRIDPSLMLDLTRQVKREMDSRRFAPSAIGGSEWRSIGPSNGAGRATAIALHPSITGTAIIGAAGGGAWMTSDGGANWRVLTDDIPNLSIGAIAFAPSDPSIVYLGTGEGGYAGDFIPGIGLLTSFDGGQSWMLPPSVAATQFYRLLVSTTDPNEVLAATNQGLLRSVNGQNGPWSQVINSIPAPGTPGYGDVTDLVRDPSDDRNLYATTWDRQFWCAKSANACPADLKFATPTVMKSVDGGLTWKPSMSGLPVSSSAQRVNRMAIAIAPSSPQTLYVATSILDNDTGKEISHIYRSTDGASTWTETGVSSPGQNSVSTYLGTQAWYGNTIVVTPSDPNTVIAGGVIYVRSTDGGATWSRVLNSVHVDGHDLRYDSANTLWIANDGGIWTSPDNASQAVEHNRGLVTRQFYAIANDPVNRNRVFGGQQDNGTVYRPDSGGASWTSFSGGDGFDCAVMPTTPAVAYATVQNGVILRTLTAGSLYRVRARTPMYDQQEVKPFHSIVQTDPRTPATVYTASYRVWKSTSAGDGWSPLPTKIDDGTAWPQEAAIRTLAISPQDPGVMMVATGSPRRRVFRTTNGGAVWTDVTGSLPIGRTILHIDIDPVDVRHAVAALAGTGGDSVWVTNNGGVSWQSRSNGLPPFSTQTVRFDPTDVNTLYAGTDVGVYRTTDGGQSWTRFGSGMPAVSVYDVDPTPDGSILRAATHGRGVWELTITDQTNQPPGVVLALPVIRTISVPKGSTVSFSGFFNDKDDVVVSASWNFPDSWTSVPAQTSETVKHRFDRTGRFPVGLSAIDSRGGVGAQTVEVDVVDPADSCATPNQIPGGGPFPYSITVTTDLATKEGADPRTQTSCYPFTAQTSTWFTFTPVTSGDYQFSLCGSEVSAVLIGYTGEACGSFTTSTLCMTRPSVSSDCDSSSVETVSLQAGQTLRMFVTNYFSDDFGNITVTVTQNSALSPIVASVAPAMGTAGTAVVINGIGFRSGATVFIGDVPAKNVQVISANSITATAGSGLTGNANVVVTNPDGTTGTLKEGFSFQYAPLGSRRRAVRH